MSRTHIHHDRIVQSYFSALPISVSDFDFDCRNLKCRLEHMGFPSFRPRVSALQIWWIGSSSKNLFWRTATRNSCSNMQTSLVPQPLISQMAPSPSTTASGLGPRAAKPTVSRQRWDPNWKTSWWTTRFLPQAWQIHSSRQCLLELPKQAAVGAVWAWKKRNMLASQSCLPLCPHRLLRILIRRFNNLPEGVFLIIFL